MAQEVEVDVSKISLPTSSIPCQAYPYGMGDRFVGLNSTNYNFNVNQFQV